MNTASTATDAYRAARERLDRQIGQINHRVRAHAERQTKTPECWAHAGDINHVIEILDEAIAFLGGHREERT